MFKIFLILFVFLFSLSTFADDDLTGKKILCDKFLWGFDFISSEKVKVITTNYNKESNVKEYYYETDVLLPYINIYRLNNIRNADFSIHHQTLRIDIWTMTAGGYTSREIISAGSCKEVKINNIVKYIEDLKK